MNEAFHRPYEFVEQPLISGKWFKIGRSYTTFWSRYEALR
jgi:hypothetical protein